MSQPIAFGAGTGGLGFLKIPQYRAGGAQRGIIIVQSEPGQGGHAEVLADAVPGVVETKRPRPPSGERAADRGAKRLDSCRRRAVGGLDVQQLRGAETDKLIHDPLGGKIDKRKRSRGKLDYRQGRRRPFTGLEKLNRGHLVRSGLIEQRLVHERARREHAGHRPIDDTLGFPRILDLVADRHAVAGLDHPPQVRLDGVIGHAGHGNAFGPLGEGDAQDLIRQHGIVAEHLIEVAHAKKQHAVGVLRFEAGMLPHGRGCAWTAGGRPRRPGRAGGRGHRLQL